MCLRSSFAGSTVLITGHSGFKGSWLSLWLVHLGAVVHGLSDGIPTSPAHYESSGIYQDVHDHWVDIRNLSDVRSTISSIQPDYIFHLAAQPLVLRSFNDPISTWSVNTLGTINLLESLRDLHKLCCVVIVTSDKAYDNVEWVWGYKETDKLGGPDPYSASKGAADIATQSYVRSYFCNNHNVRIAIARAGNVIGGGDWAEDRIVPDCVRSWSNQTVVELRSPNATRPWQHVLEPLSGYIALALQLKSSSQFHGEAFNFGPLSSSSETVGNLVSSMSSLWPGAQWADISSPSTGPHESILLKLNCDKAHHHLGWRPVWDFEHTVQATTEWYMHFYSDQLASTRQLTISQICSYFDSAKNLGLPWAC